MISKAPYLRSGRVQGPCGNIIFSQCNIFRVLLDCKRKLCHACYKVPWILVPHKTLCHSALDLVSLNARSPLLPLRRRDFTPNGAYFRPAPCPRPQPRFLRPYFCVSPLGHVDVRHLCIAPTSASQRQQVLASSAPRLAFSSSRALGHESCLALRIYSGS